MSGFLVTGALVEDTGTILASQTPVVLDPSAPTVLQLGGAGDGAQQVVRLPTSSNLQPGVRYYLANRSGVPADVQDAQMQSFATVSPGYAAEFRLLANGGWDASVYPSVRVGSENLNLQLVSSGMWSWQSSTLSLSEAAFVRIPGLPDELNRLQPFSASLFQVGSALFTKIRRSLSLASPQPLAIFTGLLDSLDTSDPDLLIIAHNIGPETSARVLIGNHLKLLPGQTEELHGTSRAKGSSGAVQFNRGDNILTADHNFVWDSTNKTLNIGGLHLSGLVGPITLLDGQSSSREIVVMDPLTVKHVVIEYSLLREGNPQMGQMLLVHDGIDASLSDNYVATNSLGIEFLASIENTGLVLSYKSTATGHTATLRYSMRYWS